MAHAPPRLGKRQDARGRRLTPISYGNLQAYARNRLGAAVAYPKESLLRSDFRLGRLDMTIWFSSKALADLCERTLVRRKHEDPSAASIEVYAIDARSVEWEPPALWGEDAGFLHASSIGSSTPAIFAVSITTMRRPGSSTIGPRPPAC